jgi:hypothetical protein
VVKRGGLRGGDIGSVDRREDIVNIHGQPRMTRRLETISRMSKKGVVGNCQPALGGKLKGGAEAEKIVAASGAKSPLGSIQFPGRETQANHMASYVATTKGRKWNVN